jgi:putative membrane protein
MKLSYKVRGVVSCLCCLCAPAWAHDTGGREDAMRWSWELFIVIPLIITAVLYFCGTFRMRRRSGVRLSLWPALSFALGLLALLAALDSPIHRIGDQLFWVHMVQHELLMLVAAPLLVIGRPLLAFLWALPRAWRERLGRWSNSRPWVAVWALISAPLVAWSIHAIALWAWHAPALFEAALKSEAIHALQHICFLGSALLFWWTLIEGRHGRLAYGSALVYVFTTAAHNSVLGALLTFAARPWYPAYLKTSSNWALTPLEDQQLGGLIMWVPMGALLLGITIALLVAWIGESQRRFEYTRLAALVKGAADAP